jgi:hypothetical protein
MGEDENEENGMLDQPENLLLKREEEGTVNDDQQYQQSKFSSDNFLLI